MTYTTLTNQIKELIITLNDAIYINKTKTYKKTIVRTITSLEQFIKNYDEINNKINKDVNDMQKKVDLAHSKFENMRSVAKCIVDKLEFMCSFGKTLYNLFGDSFENSGLTGPLMKRVFEFPVTIIDYASFDNQETKILYGNPINDDINVCMIFI